MSDDPDEITRHEYAASLRVLSSTLRLAELAAVLGRVLGWA
jgi:hypothetical protein